MYLDSITNSFGWVSSVGCKVYDLVLSNIKDISIFDTLIISDGVQNAYKYFYEFLIMKFTKDNNESQNKKVLVNNCKRLYELDYIDRYLLYIIVYIVLGCIQLLANDIVYIKSIIYIFSLMLSLPSVQNTLVNINLIHQFVISFIEKKNTFVHYSLSKTLIRFIQGLSPDVIDIQNLHIFILYNYLTFDFLSEFIRTFLFIAFLHTIRQHQTTYYYYKAIKLSYYYNTGYLFNVISKNDAVYLINNMIKQKQWKHFCKREIVNALYCLWTNDLNTNYNWVQINFITIRIFAVWSTLCLFKIFSTVLNTYFLIAYNICLYIFNVQFKKRHIALSILIYTLVVLNINELLISIVFIKYNILYESIIDFVFFITNYHQLRKIINFYASKM